MDLVAENDSEKIAIEIETGKSDALYNLTKDLSHAFDEIIIAKLKGKR